MVPVSPWPRNLAVPSSGPRKQQPRERARRKAAAASVAKKSSRNPRKMKTGKAKREAKGLLKSKVVRPRLPGLRWKGWESNAQGKGKQLRGNNRACLRECDPWLWDGESPSGCQKQPVDGRAALPCLRMAEPHHPGAWCQMCALSDGAATSGTQHGGSELASSPAVLLFGDVVFMQATKILDFSHHSLCRATNLILGNPLLWSCSYLFPV